MLYLKEPFSRLWKDCNPFDEVERFEGKVFRALEARKTLQFYCEGKSYFLKIHRGVGWLEILDNLLRGRCPVLGAEDEYRAIKKLEGLGIDTMSVSAFGKNGRNPAKQKSFIITDDLTETISLEDFCLSWKDKAPDFYLKKGLIKKVALISKILHENGVNHRDYYLCHFLLHIPNGVNRVNANELVLSLIDLHRAQIRSKTPQRWVVKDIAALWFSALDIGLTTRDLYRFIRYYTGLPLREAFLSYQGLWQPLQDKAQKMHQRKQRKGETI